MSNSVTALNTESFNHSSTTMTLENLQATQADENCRNIQAEQREESLTTKVPASPPGSGGSINSDENISLNSIAQSGQMSDTVISTGVNTNNIITLMQSSPPPHSYRHSRAYRHFKNPPQPHMCIRTTTEAGEELFINVLSWTRIVIPQEPSDPIPLYGGMRVPPGSPRSPPIVFAVMANPEVLKDSGRHSKDPEERRAMVELMCDFVEAMNPGVKLVRNAVILKDRDISGELKDVWNAVQAQRDREREEQMLQQRQQQHYHNITTQQMFPKTGEGNPHATIITTGQASQQMAGQQHYQYASQQEQYIDNAMVQIGTAENDVAAATNVDMQYVDNESESESNATADRNNVINNEAMHFNENNVNEAFTTTITESNNHVTPTTECEGTPIAAINGNIDIGDQTDAGNKSDRNGDAFTDNKSSANNNNNKNINTTNTAANITTTTKTKETPTPTGTAATPATSPKSANAQVDVAKLTATVTTTAAITTAAATNVSNNTTTTTTTTTASNLPSKLTTSTSTPISTPPTKKDKLGGFLPNGCIFPRFKHNKNKDKEKEKDKDKESKGKDKEKTLLNALKKSKEKKVAPSEQLEKTSSTTTTMTMTTMMTATTTTTTMTTASDAMVDSKSQYEKNFINLENEVQRLDLNKIDATTGNDNSSSMFIKLKMSTSSAAAK